MSIPEDRLAELFASKYYFNGGTVESFPFNCSLVKYHFSPKSLDHLNHGVRTRAGVAAKRQKMKAAKIRVIPKTRCYIRLLTTYQIIPTEAFAAVVGEGPFFFPNRGRAIKFIKAAAPAAAPEFRQ